ncbi:MAG: hypothetical protein ACJ786_04290 [Catenulispora sp.]
MSMFSQPASGGGFFKPAEAEGHLVLVTRVHGFDKHFDSMKGAEIDRATVDLVDLDAPGAPLRERMWLTHPGLVNKVSTTGPVLGRIGKVQASKGMAWSLMPFTEGTDDAAAEKWLADNPTVSTAPVPQAAAPAPAPAAAQSFGGNGAPPVNLNDMRTVGNTGAGNSWDQLSEQQRAAALAALQQQRGQDNPFADAPPF